MKRSSPAFQRNRDPIAQALEQVLPPRGTVLEIASGPGAHAAFLAGRFPALQWQPSDIDGEAIASISAWVDDAGLSNLLPPLRIDVAELPWPIDRADTVLNVNMLHVSSFPRCAQGLFAGAATVLRAGQPLVIYGPFFRADVETASSNLEFDASLRARNPEWGLRSVPELEALAAHCGMALASIVEVPANNCVLVFERR